MDQRSQITQNIFPLELPCFQFLVCSGRKIHWLQVHDLIKELLHRVQFTGASDALNVRVWVKFDSEHFTAQNIRNGENWQVPG